MKVAISYWLTFSVVILIDASISIHLFKKSGSSMSLIRKGIFLVSLFYFVSHLSVQLLFYPNSFQIELRNL